METQRFDVIPKEWENLLKGRLGIALNILIVVFFIYHVGYALGIFNLGFIWLDPDSFVLGSVLLTLALVFIFLPAKGMTKKNITWYDFALIAGAILGTGYLMANLYMLAGMEPITRTGMIVGTIFTLVVLEAARRTMGLPIVIMILAFFLYAMFSNYFPGILWSRGFSYRELIANSYIYDNGMFGMIAKLWAKLFVLYLLFAGIIQVSGAGKLVMDFALGVAGHLRGGAAKVAVIASGLVGSIAPSGPANIALTGSITIPLMKRTGQTPEFAAATEAVASSMGSLTPPLMGALSFVIAEWLEMPYYMVMLAAFLPSVLFFIGLFFMVHFHSARVDIPPLRRSELPSVRLTLKQGWHYVLPIFVLIYFLFVMRYSPQTSIVYATGALLLTGQFRKDYRLNPKRLLHGLQRAARIVMMPGPIMISLGIIIASLGLTGMPIRFTGLIVDFCGGSRLLLLIICGVAAFILGSGLPILAVYFILAILVAPAIIETGVPPIAAHLFVCYAAISHLFTPPVMSSVIIASALAESHIWRTAWTAIRLGITAFIIPFFFVYHPSVLLQSIGIAELALALVFGLAGILCLASGIQGWLVKRANLLQRLLLIASGIMMTLSFGNVIIAIIGLCLMVLILLWQGVTPASLAAKFRRS